MKGDRYLKGQEFSANLTYHIIAVDCRFSLSQKVDKTDLSFPPLTTYPKHFEFFFFPLSCNTHHNCLFLIFEDKEKWKNN